LTGRDEVLGHVGWFIAAVEDFRFYDLQLDAFAEHAKASLNEVARQLNSRPRKKLNYETTLNDLANLLRRPVESTTHSRRSGYGK
jgi:hypothetical protein